MITKIIIFFNLLVTSVIGANVTFTAIFDHDLETPELEYVVEVRQADGSWVETARGPTSPIVFTTAAKYGSTLVARVFVRVVPNPLPRNTSLDTSNEASATVVPKKPANAKISPVTATPSP